MKLLWLAALALPGVAWAEAEQPLSDAEVVVTAPLPGSELDARLAATSAQSLDPAALERRGPPVVLQALEARLTGVSLSGAQDNPFQPNLVYRGFQASPLAGDAQGLAVYVDGARFNQPFGDTVDWDLIPDAATASVDLVGSSPAFGLNALGGALSVRLKSGFTDAGNEAAVSGGSFGRWSIEAQHGGSDMGRAVYLAFTAAHDDGWRDHSASDLRQAYAGLGWKDDRSELRLTLLGADNRLTGNGPAPVELLQARRSSVFTYPDVTFNRHLRIELSGQSRLGGGWSADAAAYLGYLDQHTRNADVSDVEPCDHAPGTLCLNGDPAFDSQGAPIADVLDGGPYAQLNRTSTRSTAFGASFQLSNQGRLGGHDNRLLLGASLDGGHTGFSASSELGAMTADRGFGAPIAIIDQPDGSIAPVKVRTDNRYAGLYGQDLLQLTSALSLDVSARLNLARLNLHDELGQALNGHHDYARFNPSVGATYRVSPQVTAYLDYARANRTPTPAELSCAGPDRPCSLTNFFVGDPDLKQVTAVTFEGGLRGQTRLGPDASLRWTLDAYRTSSHDEIVLSASDLHGRAFFQNIAATRRQGVDARLELRTPRISAWAAYALSDATFRSALVLNSPDNPMADAAGLIHVRPGDRMPGVPLHRLKLGLDWDATGALRLGASAILSSGQVLFGDEANLTPQAGGYAVFDVDGAWRIGRRLQLFGQVSNLFDARYETFGTFCPTSQVRFAEAPGISDPRCLSPAAPRSVRLGLRVEG
jgi:outer membrane receptor protein involved in Fe transport